VKTTLSLSLDHRTELPAQFADDDVRYPESLIETFLREYTQPGARVFDPFAGYGTTLVVAEALGREAYGLELEQAKADFGRSRLKHPQRLIQGDARHLASIGLPVFDFSMTSPPYTSKDDALDPLSAYTVSGKGYRAYLRELHNIYAQLRALMKPAGVVVLEVSNIKRNGRVTTLAWDIATEVSRVMQFEGEVVVAWDRNTYGYDHSYCLVFSVI